jgi:hypothetical protein
MSLIRKLLGKEEESEEETQEEDGEEPCNVSGHNYKQKYDPKYYATSVKKSLTSRNYSGKAFKIYKSTGMKCTKCGGYKKKEEDVGMVEVDTETDEITVVE